MVVGVIDIPAGGRSERIVARVGDASYSTYLTHPCLTALLWMVGGYAPTMSPYLFALAFIVASTMLGLAVPRWIERPLLQILARQRKAAAPVATDAALA